MPIFEFECPVCHKREERMFVRVEQADAGDVWCDHGEPPRSISYRMQRVPTAGAFVLKGSGFHCVDYKDKK